jgi:hypothetical protein
MPPPGYAITRRDQATSGQLRSGLSASVWVAPVHIPLYPVRSLGSVLGSTYLTVCCDDCRNKLRHYYLI